MKERVARSRCFARTGRRASERACVSLPASQQHPESSDYLKRAAEQAADRSAVSEAESQLRDALSLMPPGPAKRERDLQELELQTSLCAILVSRGFGAPEREQPLLRAYELCERIGNERETLSVLYQLGQFYIQQARFSEARTLAERAARLADDAKDQILEAGAQENLGECCFWTGDLQTARAYFERALACCEDASRQALIRLYGFDLSTLPPPFLGLVELLLGWPERAMQWDCRTIEQVRSTAHPYSQALGLVIASLQRCIRADFESASECLIPVRKLCDHHGFREIAGWTNQVNGWSQFWIGTRDLGVSEMREAIQTLGAVRSFITSPWRSSMLAEMQLEMGDFRTAETLLEEALKTLKSTKEGWYEAELYRFAAKVMWKKPERDPIGAEKYLRRAIAIARNQATKWWELRATTSLARLVRDSGRAEEARTILAELQLVHRRFRYYRFERGQGPPRRTLSFGATGQFNALFGMRRRNGINDPPSSLALCGHSGESPKTSRVRANFDRSRTDLNPRPPTLLT
jgi:tetratricopeptide (TPR) repeat protein